MRAAALVLATLLLAGCTSNPFGGPVELTAREAAALAQPRAQQWHGDAVLGGLVGFEAGANSNFTKNFSDTGGNISQPAPDSRVADGRAPLWLAIYHSPSANRSLGVAVHGNGTLETQESEPDGDSKHLDMAAWQVDSPRAVEIALQDANFSAAAKASDGGLVAALGMGDTSGNASEARDPFWFLTAGSEATRMGAFVLVNARTGERSNFSFPGMGNLTFGPGGWTGGGGGEARSYNFQGALTATQREGSHPFPVRADDLGIVASVTYGGQGPTDSVTIELQDASGQVLEPENSSGSGRGTYTASYETRAPGSYKVVARLASQAPVPTTVQVSYQVSLSVF